MSPINSSGDTQDVGSVRYSPRHNCGVNMSEHEIRDVVILGSGQGGKQLAWHLARSGKRVAVVARNECGV